MVLTLGEMVIVDNDLIWRACINRIFFFFPKQTLIVVLLLLGEVATGYNDLKWRASTERSTWVGHPSPEGSHLPSFQPSPNDPCHAPCNYLPASHPESPDTQVLSSACTKSCSNVYLAHRHYNTIEKGGTLLPVHYYTINIKTIKYQNHMNGDLHVCSVIRTMDTQCLYFIGGNSIY